MQYRRLGKSGLKVSAVGFGTCQLRLVSSQQAIDTLQHGFSLGVNVVHTTPDYEGADDIVAQAVLESGREVTILTQGYGNIAHFEWLFETACRKFGKPWLEMYGIACIDDREYLGEDVWGPSGMVNFLLEKKRNGRLRSIFCTTHGKPEYVRRLITSGVFDAIMLAYNPIGFHLLSYFPEKPRVIENVPENRDLFSFAAGHDVGIIVMKSLAGGLLCKGKAFPPRVGGSDASAGLTASEILRSILLNPGVSCVMPGTASVAEAEENALAGHLPVEESPQRMAAIIGSISRLKTELCSRCGMCEAGCSKKLPISWLFRDAYINLYPSETFETIDQLRYFHLHPDSVAACRTCTDRTCSCPSGIDIPAALMRIHDQMIELRHRGLLPATPHELGLTLAEGPRAAVVVSKEIHTTLLFGQKAMCRLCLENCGEETWRAGNEDDKRSGTQLIAFCADKILSRVPVRHEVPPGTRTHFAFEYEAPENEGTFAIQFSILVPQTIPPGFKETEVLTVTLSVLPAFSRVLQDKVQRAQSGIIAE